MTKQMKYQVAGMPLTAAHRRQWAEVALPAEQRVHQQLVRFWPEEFEPEVMQPLLLRMRRDCGDTREWWRIDMVHLLGL